jgi:CheY-like chemotaxis protein
LSFRGAAGDEESCTVLENTQGEIPRFSRNDSQTPESSYNQLVVQVFLAGKDWQARALLRAQLLEEGVGVEAFETVREALAQLEFYAVRPALLLADISASDHPSADGESLANWAKRIPIWIIASHTSSVPGGLDGRGFERLLFRPIDLGELVEQVRQRVGRR